MKNLEKSRDEIVDLGKATVETKGAGFLYVDAGIGKRDSAPGIVDD